MTAGSETEVTNVKTWWNGEDNLIIELLDGGRKTFPLHSAVR